MSTIESRQYKAGYERCEKDMRKYGVFGAAANVDIYEDEYIDGEYPGDYAVGYCHAYYDEYERLEKK